MANFIKTYMTNPETPFASKRVLTIKKGNKIVSASIKSNHVNKIVLDETVAFPKNLTHFITEASVLGESLVLKEVDDTYDATTEDLSLKNYSSFVNYDSESQNLTFLM